MVSIHIALDASCEGGSDLKLKILLADDHQLFREALRSMLEKEPDIEVVGEVGDGRDVLRVAGQTLPDVVCMDVGMPGVNGIEATRRLVAGHPRVKVIGVSAFYDRRFVLDMLNAGATGYVTKGEAGDELLRAIHAVRRNQTYLCPEVSAGGVDALRNGTKDAVHSAPRLGSREKEVLQLLAEGRTSPQIAVRMHLASSTVEVHRRNIMRKLSLHTIAELTKYAIRQGLTTV